MSVYNDKSLDKDESEEKEDVRYVSFPFIAPFLPQKKSNRLINIGKRTRNLNHLI